MAGSIKMNSTKDIFCRRYFLAFTDFFFFFPFCNLDAPNFKYYKKKKNSTNRNLANFAS